MSKIKVCHIVSGLINGGVEKVIENYYKYINKELFEFSIITQSRSDKNHIKFFEELGIKVFIVTHKKDNPVKHYFEMKRILKNNKFDIIHSHMTLTNFYVLKLAKKYGVKIRINHFHNYFNEKGLRKLLTNLLIKKCEKYATLNLCCSEKVCDYARFKNAIVLNNCFEIDEYKYNQEYRNIIRNELKLNEDVLAIGMIGRFSKQKNFEFVLKKILPELRKFNIKINFFIIGNGSEKRKLLYTKLIHNYKLENLVQFTGVVDVKKYYSALDVLLMPSLYEGLGNVAIESQVSNLNLITSVFVPKETIFNANAIQLELNRDLWIKQIIHFASCKNDRNKQINSLIYKKYDLKSNFNNLENIYVKAMEECK